MRLTVGITPVLEWGMQVPLVLRWEEGQSSVLVERLGMATKVLLTPPSYQFFRLSCFAGVQFPLMARLWGADAGLVFDLQPTKWLIFNVSGAGLVDWLQVATFGARYDVGVGAYFWPDVLQLVVEWSHAYNLSTGASKATLGVAINWYVDAVTTVLVGGLFDLFGTQEPQNIQLAFSLAFAIDLRTTHAP